VKNETGNIFSNSSISKRALTGLRNHDHPANQSHAKQLGEVSPAPVHQVSDQQIDLTLRPSESVTKDWSA
jgi:hypothetical protein